MCYVLHAPIMMNLVHQLIVWNVVELYLVISSIGYLILLIMAVSWRNTFYLSLHKLLQNKKDPRSSHFWNFEVKTLKKYFLCERYSNNLVLQCTYVWFKTIKDFFYCFNENICTLSLLEYTNMNHPEWIKFSISNIVISNLRLYFTQKLSKNHIHIQCSCFLL